MQKFNHSLLSHAIIPFTENPNHPSATIAVAVAAAAASFLLFHLLSKSALKFNNNRKESPPEAGGAWPIIGHLHVFGGPTAAHRVLGQMADKYGPIFTIRMGRAHQRAIVVSNWETAKECLTTNDKAFIVNRPQTIATEVLGYDGALFGFSQAGHYWTEIRKLINSEVLSPTRIRSLVGPVLESHLRFAMKELHALFFEDEVPTPVSVDMNRWLGDVTLNIILKIVYGKTVGLYYSRDHDEDGASGRLKKLVREFFDSLLKFGVGDVFPGLRWMDIGGHEKGLKKTAEELDNVVQEWLGEHKEKKRGGEQKGGEEDDFMGLLLNVLDERRLVFQGRDCDTINKATCLGLTLAASDSSTVTMVWALSLLVNHPNALKKVQLELDEWVGRERRVQESDLHNLHYLKAVVKETLRLYPPGPVLMRGESGEDCSVSGYHVPKGTQLFINIQKLQSDPRVWDEPHEFSPERFLTTHKDVDVRGQHYEMLPFSSGRRMCPGVSFALEVMHLTLAVLLHGYDVATSTLVRPVDMVEANGGFVNMKATHLEVFLSPRLPARLYEDVD